MKPILFNTEMVRAILDGRKTVTRRLVKPQPGFFFNHGGMIPEPDNPNHIAFVAVTKDGDEEIYVPPYQSGDVLYVREAWRIRNVFGDWNLCNRSAEIEFRAGGPNITLHNITRRFEDWIKGARWLPSIHMPKKVARIFLRVKCVRVERLQDITVEQVAAEGIDNAVPCDDAQELCNYCPLPDGSKGVHCYGGNVHMCEGSHCKEALEYWEEEFIGDFAGLWESTIKDKDIATDGWDANPWVWVIEFERCEKPEEVKK